MIAIVAIVSVFTIIQPVFAAPEPTVTTELATNISHTSATINGSAPDAGDKPITSRGFNYGISDSYGNSTIENTGDSYDYALKWGDSSTFNLPLGVAIDSAGDVYVVDSNNGRVQKFNSSGVHQSQFGSSGSGNGQFSAPRGITINSSGDIYIADSGNKRVQKFNSSGVYQSQFGSSGTGNGQFSQPTSIAIDSADNIYVLEGINRRVQKFNSSGVYQSKFGSSGTGNGQLNYSYDIAVDSANYIYIADSGNNRVQKFNSSGVYQSQFGSSGTGNGQFTFPRGIAISSSGDLYVADSNSNRIQKFTENTDMHEGDFSANLSSLACGTVYHYRAYANNPEGLAQGDDATFTTLACEPEPPSNPFAASSSSTTFDVSWDIPNNTGDSPITSYIIRYRVVGEMDWQEYDTQSVAPNATLTGLSGNTEYDIAIVAKNSNNHISDESEQITALTISPAPGQPTNLQGVVSSATTIDLSWDEPGYTGDAPISSYTVIYRVVGEQDWQNFETFNSNTTTQLSGLSPSTDYEIKILARNGFGDGPESDLITVSIGVAEPDPPTNLQATVGSPTSINLSWDAPTYTGLSPISQYYIGYRKVGEPDWYSLSTYETNIVLNYLEPSTQYEILINAENEDGYALSEEQVSATQITATTGTPGFYLISNCQQLQDINNDLVGNYELSQDIDCSDTINWNDGAGFAPIGSINQELFFSGILAGNNYSINDLYINNQEEISTALFGFASGALFQDLRIVRPVITGQFVVAGLLGYDNSLTTTDTTIINVHINDGQLQTEASVDSEFNIVGGLVGVSASNGTPTDTRNEFRGILNASGPLKNISVGGLYGSIIGSRHIDNSYADVEMTVYNNLTEASGIMAVGGLLGDGGLLDSRSNEINGDISFNHSYAAGNITTESTDPSQFNVVGGVSGAVVSTIGINNSFAHTTLTNLSPPEANFTGGVLGAYVGETPTDSTNSYFDADLSGTTDCMSPNAGTLSGCTAISGQPNYFYNNSVNSPLNTWDFENIWSTTSTLPIFNQKVLTAITEIPASRLTVKPPATPAATRGGTVELPSELLAQKPIVRSGVKNTVATQGEEPGFIGAIKRFFKNIPAGVLIRFPYALFGLLLLGSIAMFIEVILQHRRLRATKLLIIRQKAVAEERDTFWHLAANYLRAPITLMVGGIELLSTDKDIRSPAVARLEMSATSLQKKVFGIMKQIEQSTTLQDIEWPKLESGGRVLGQVRFWLPVGVVASFAILMNYIAKDYRNLNLSVINLGAQVMIFALVSLLFYWVLSAFGLVSRKRDQANKLLDQQNASLDTARTTFIEQSASTLDADLFEIEELLDKLPEQAAPAASVGIVREGTHRLRSLIDSFELLVAAQNNKLDELSPQDAHSQLNTVFESVVRSLEPVIMQKQIKLVKPDFRKVALPGNTLLLNQVIGSVITNAIDFSPNGNTIKFDLKSQNNSVNLSVTNQGEPISDEQIAHVFNPFVKADGYDALRLDHGGLGVDLYIDKLIMQHLGGKMNISSKEGLGTTMTMSWPVLQKGHLGA